MGILLEVFSVMNFRPNGERTVASQIEALIIRIAGVKVSRVLRDDGERIRNFDSTLEAGDHALEDRD